MGKEDHPKRGVTSETAITFIVCLTLLGVVDLIGLFWGSDGLVKTAQGILVIIMAIGGLIVLSSSRGD